MTQPTQGVHIRRIMYASGTPAVLQPYFYEDNYDKNPNTDVLDPVMENNPLLAISGYTFDGIRQVVTSIVVADTTAPTVVITSASSETVAGAFDVTITFSESVNGFVLGDITVSANASAGSFSGSGAVYTATITPTAIGTVTVNIAADVAQDSSGNKNTAATQFSIISTSITSPAISPTLGAELLVNPGFEGVYENEGSQLDLAPDWNNSGADAGSDTLAESATAHGGSNSQSINVNVSGEGIITTAAALATVGWYHLSAWLNITSGAVRITDTNGVISNVLSITGSYLQVNATGRTIAINRSVLIRSINAGANFLIDDASAKAITLSSMFSTLLGTLPGTDGAYTSHPTVAKGTQAGMAIAYLNATNFVVAFVDRTDVAAALASVKLLKYVAGVWTEVITGAVTYSAAAELKVIISGTSCSLFYGGTQVGTEQTISDSLGEDVYGFNAFAGSTVGVVTSIPLAAVAPDTLLSKLSERELIATATTGDWIGRPSILDDGSKWIMVYRAGALHGYDANARVHIRFSTDEGATWTAENTFTNAAAVTGAPFAGDDTNDLDMPLIVKAPNGNLLVIGGEKTAVSTSHNSSQLRSTDGGETWTDEGVVISDTKPMDTIVIGATIYMAAFTNDGANEKSTLWKSINDGTTWTKISDITSFAGDGKSVNECSICNPSGNTLVVMMRDAAKLATYVRISTDLGATWGNIFTITGSVGIIQRPRLRIFADEPNRIYMIGRLIYDVDNDPERSVVAYSDNGGVTWKTPFNIETADQTDCGYADILKKANGDLYTVSYQGTYTAATIYEYILDVL